MYQIKCDDFYLYDPRDEELTVLNPKCSLKVNTVGSASFTILPTHPWYDSLQKLKSVFEICQDGQAIFRGRMTGGKRDFNNRLDVKLEGVLAYTNDSIIPPFRFPEDFPEAEQSANVVEYFLGWILTQHNSQVEEFQQLKLGKVTVKDPNNYLSRSSEKPLSTWKILQSRLFDSALGGYLCIRCEDDGNYVDYVDSFELTNTQPIRFGENLLDLTNQMDADETYTAIYPQGAVIEPEGGEPYTLTLDGLPDGELDDGDLVKQGRFIYSKSAREQYGWICVPIEDSTWEDVTEAVNLQTKAMEKLTGSAMWLSDTITAKAVDLHFTDEEVQALRIYRNVLVDSPVHGVNEESYALLQLNLDLFNPQKTKITVGKTVRTLTEIHKQQQSSNITRIETVEKDIAENRTEISGVANQILTNSTQMLNDCNQIILGALEDYSKTSDLESFKQTMEAQLKVLADNISMNFTKTTQQTENVNGDLQSKFEKLYKYIRFSGDTAVSIGSGDSAIILELDNESGIVFKRNNVQFGKWDGDNFYTGNIVIRLNERAQFGNFAFVPRSDGSLSFLKVGG